MLDLNNDLNEEQREAVLNGDGYTLVLAGAGSGKTRVLTYRVAYLQAKGVPADNILLLTFTNKAAKEMLDRVAYLTNSRITQVTGGTFHHVGNIFLKKFHYLLNLSSSFSILDEEDRINFLNQLLKLASCQLFAPDGKKIKASLISEIFSLKVNTQKSFSEILKLYWPNNFNYDLNKNFENLFEIFQTKKKEKNLVDFDDLLFYWFHLLESYPEVQNFVLNKFKFVLVDEFQDTNFLQGKIIERLGKITRNLFAVGDDAQAIYSFRGATIENILSFPQIFQPTKIFYLKENYRSTNLILSLANEIIKQEQRQFQKQLFSRLGEGFKPNLILFGNQREEACFVVDKIMDFLEEGEELKNSVILFRAAYQAIECELELQKRGVPYVLRGGLRFFEQAHIKDVLAYLKVLINPSDEVSWRRVILLEEGLGERSAEVILNKIGRQPTQQIFNNFAKEKALLKYNSFFDRIQKIYNYFSKNKEDIGDLVQFVVSQYQNLFKNKYDNFEERKDDLEQLIAFSRQYSNLEAFLSESLLTENSRHEFSHESQVAKRDYLVLSTIHQAKGLEWNNVFLIGLVNGFLPHYRSFQSSEQLAEERRLFYVAITRAKRKLFLTAPLAHDQENLSVFLKDVDPSSIDCHNFDNRFSSDYEPSIFL